MISDSFVFLMDLSTYAFLSDSILQVKCNDQVLKKWKEEEKRDIRYTGGEVEEGFVVER